MKRVSGFCVLFLTLCLLAALPEKEAEGPLVFTHVTVIDCTGAAPKPDMTVVITGNRITALGRTGKVKLPTGAQVIEAQGKYLIPGLWDMHVHGTIFPFFAELYIANGVTGVRDMGVSSLEAIKRLRADEEVGKRVGPHIVAGRIVDGPKPIWPGSIAVKDAEEGRKAVQSLKKEGWDFVKVYSLLPREAYFALAKEARKERIPFVGHLPMAVSAQEASDAGQRSIEHLDGVLLDCSTHAEQLRKERVEALAQSDGLRAFLRLYGTQTATLLATYHEEKANTLFKRFKKNRTWHCPTLTVLRALASLRDPEFTNDPRLNYMSPFIRQMWNPTNDFRFRDIPPEGYAALRKSFEKHRELVGKMRRAGVELLAGTDAINPYCFPGFSLHDELALLVEAGLTPMEALQAATRNPARFLGKERELGTVEKGKIADLVLLNADPLKEIRNTTQIQAVVLNGKLLTREQLDKILADAKRAAGTKN